MTHQTNARFRLADRWGSPKSFVQLEPGGGKDPYHRETGQRAPALELLIDPPCFMTNLHAQILTLQEYRRRLVGMGSRKQTIHFRPYCCNLRHTYVALIAQNPESHKFIQQFKAPFHINDVGQGQNEITQGDWQMQSIAKRVCFFEIDFSNKLPDGEGSFVSHPELT